jgi:O-antigen/teichoic acid export membrane protein
LFGARALRLSGFVKHERHRKALHTFGASLVSRALNSGIRLLLIPMSVRILGHERYGLWLAAGSLVAWLGITDLGFGGGLVNALGTAYGKDDQLTIRRHLSAARLYYGGLAVVIALLAWGLAKTPAADHLLGVSGRPDLSAETRSLILVLGLLFAALVYFGRIYSIALAFQHGYWTHYSSIITGVLSLLVLAFLVGRDCSLAAFALLMGAPQVAVAIALSVFLHRRPPYKQVRPEWSLCTAAGFRSLSGFAGPLFFAQVAELAMMYSANILIASRFGPSEVPRYAVPFSLFQFCAGTFGVLLHAYWPAFVEAGSRGDWAWLRRAATRSICLVVGCVAAGNLVLFALGDEAVLLLAGRQATPGRPLLGCLAVYGVLMVWAYGAGVLALGLGWLRLRAALRMVAAAGHLLGFFWLSRHLGLRAFPVAGGAGFLLEAVAITLLASRHIGRQSRQPAQVRDTLPVAAAQEPVVLA